METWCTKKTHGNGLIEWLFNFERTDLSDRRRKLLHSIFENCTVTSISNFRNGRRYAMSFSDKDAEKIQFPSKQVKSVS